MNFKFYANDGRIFVSVTSVLKKEKVKLLDIYQHGDNEL